MFKYHILSKVVILKQLSEQSSLKSSCWCIVQQKIICYQINKSERAIKKKIQGLSLPSYCFKSASYKGSCRRWLTGKRRPLSQVEVSTVPVSERATGLKWIHWTLTSEQIEESVGGWWRDGPPGFSSINIISFLPPPTLRFSNAGTRAARTGQICSSNQVMSTSSSNKKVGTHALTHKVLTYIEYRAVSGVVLTLHPQRVCPPPPALAGQWGGGASILRKTPDIGLASYSIIPLRPCHSLRWYNVETKLLYCISIRVAQLITNVSNNLVSQLFHYKRWK
jgi:hypothetical protein